MKKVLIILAMMATFTAPAHAAYPWLDFSRFFAEQPVYSEGEEWMPGDQPQFVGNKIAGGNYWTGGCKVWDWISSQARRSGFFRV